MLKKLLEKIIKFLNKIIHKLGNDGESSTVKPTPVPPEDIEVPIQTEPQPNETTDRVDPSGDPKFTDMNKLNITSFLWKPESDTNPKVTVITVSADTIRSDDLRVYLFDKHMKPIPGETQKNKFSNGRGNQLPNHRYGRINYKPGMRDEEYAKMAPITVKFKLATGEPVSIMNKSSVVIKNPTRRVDLK